jgi:hypothetical protein
VAAALASPIEVRAVVAGEAQREADALFVEALVDGEAHSVHEHCPESEAGQHVMLRNDEW